MNKISWIFLLPVMVSYTSCNDLLSKFHQHGYKVKDVRIQLMSYDEDYFDLFIMKPFKFNRTITGHNLTFRCKIEMKDKIEVVVELRKFLSNEYHSFAVRYQVNLVKVVKANVMGLADSVKCGNFTTFYIHKDVTYHVCNFAIDETGLPPLIPNGIYRTDLEFTYLDKPIALLYFYGEIYTPIKYPKK